MTMERASKRSAFANPAGNLISAHACVYEHCPVPPIEEQRKRYTGIKEMCCASAGGGTGGESMRGECDNKQAMLQMSEHPRD